MTWRQLAAHHQFAEIWGWLIYQVSRVPLSMTLSSFQPRQTCLHPTAAWHLGLKVFQHLRPGAVLQDSTCVGHVRLVTGVSLAESARQLYRRPPVAESARQLYRRPPVAAASDVDYKGHAVGFFAVRPFI